MSAPGPTKINQRRAGRDTRFELPDRKGRPGRLPPESASVITRRITAIALALGIVMALGKVWLFSITGSVGVLASLVHSALDMIAAASSFIAVRFAARLPNQNYRFGFGKAESFSAVFQVCLIGLVAFHLLGIAGDALIGTGGLESDHSTHAHLATHAHLGPEHGHDQSGQNPSGHNPSGKGHIHAIDGSITAILVMSAFIGLTLLLLTAQTWAIQATGSIAIRGDRAHYTADLFGNLFVIIGLAVATFTKAHWADAAVGIVMALWLLLTGYRVARLAWAQLMDQELTPDERTLITSRVMTDPRIRAVSNLRTRASGPHLHMQMRLDLDPHLSLSESHDIVVDAEARLMSAFPAADILIHPHPTGCAQAHGNIRFNTE